MHSSALLLGYILTCLVWYLCTGLFSYCPALLGRNIIAHLLWNIFTVIVGHLLQPLLLHVPTLVISIVLAGPLDWGPHLVVPCPLPLVLTVLLVLSAALLPLLGYTLLLVLCVALLD